MNDLLSRCVFPALNAPYAQALSEAVRLILTHYTPCGIIAAGSILRGTPDRTSDLDLYVIHTASFRQRLQRFFNGVPAEIFINPPAQVERYFVDEQVAGKPITAHMLATGFVILSTDPLVEQLRRRAQQLLTQQPNWSAVQLTWTRYLAGNLYEDGLDMAEGDPATAQVFLSRAVIAMLEYFFQAHGLFLPRSKELLERLAQVEPGLAAAARSFFTSGDFTERLQLAKQIAGATIGVYGFFEWDSAPEEVST